MKGWMRAVWGSAPGPLSPSAVGQDRTAGEPPAPHTSPAANGAGKSFPNHREGCEARWQYESPSANEEIHQAGMRLAGQQAEAGHSFLDPQSGAVEPRHTGLGEMSGLMGLV